MSFSRTVRSEHLVSTSVLPSFSRYFDAIASTVSFWVRKFVHTGSLDVTDDRTGLVVHELDANLGNTTARAYKNPP